jgi:hypothetical protein
VPLDVRVAPDRPMAIPNNTSTSSPQSWSVWFRNFDQASGLRIAAPRSEYVLCRVWEAFSAVLIVSPRGAAATLLRGACPVVTESLYGIDVDVGFVVLGG